jgi:hypothetical protein
MIDHMNALTTETGTSLYRKLPDHAELLAEQAHLVARLSEITSLMSSGCLPEPSKTATAEPCVPSDFDRKAYAIGLIWRNPNIATRDLAKKVGVARSTLSLPTWKDVADVLRARRNLSASDYKKHHIDEDDDE